MSIVIKSILQSLKNVWSEINSINEVLVDPYPIGSIYTTVENINPSDYFGGIWERFANGRCLVGVNEDDRLFQDPLQTGGDVSHRHNFKIGLGWYYGAAIGERPEDSNAGAYKYSTGTYDPWTVEDYDTTARRNNGVDKGNSTISATVSSAVGDTTTSNNYQPYITVYFWRRTG